MNEERDRSPVLLVRLGSRLCAIPLAAVLEGMRPLPTEPVQGMLPFLRGLAVIRGSPVPVVDLGILIGAGNDAPAGRFVLLQVGERRIALAVEEVLGVRNLDGPIMQSLPPLLRDADSESVTAVGVRDEQLLFVLQLAWVIPDEVWRTLESGGVSE